MGRKSFIPTQFDAPREAKKKKKKKISERWKTKGKKDQIANLFGLVVGVSSLQLVGYWTQAKTKIGTICIILKDGVREIREN